MSESEVQTWEAEIPADTIRRAYVYENEFAWSKADAITVVQLLQSRGYLIYGVDTWIPTRPGPTPVSHDWSSARATISAVEFIETFVWEPIHACYFGMDLHFNLTVGDREQEV